MRAIRAPLLTEVSIDGLPAFAVHHFLGGLHEHALRNLHVTLPYSEEEPKEPPGSLNFNGKPIRAFPTIRSKPVDSLYYAISSEDLFDVSQLWELTPDALHLTLHIVNDGFSASSLLSLLSYYLGTVNGIVPLPNLISIEGSFHEAFHPSLVDSIVKRGLVDLFKNRSQGGAAELDLKELQCVGARDGSLNIKFRADLRKCTQIQTDGRIVDISAVDRSTTR